MVYTKHCWFLRSPVKSVCKGCDKAMSEEISAQYELSVCSAAVERALQCACKRWVKVMKGGNCV
jgi:hypothetical protein